MKARSHLLVPILVIAAIAILATTLSEKGNVYSDIRQSVILPTAPREIHAEATLLPQEGAEVTLGSQLAGQIKHVYVKEGDRVHYGELLVELESSEEQAQLTEAQARLAQSEVDLHYQQARLGRAKQLSYYGTTSREESEHVQYDADEASTQADISRAVVARLSAQMRKTSITAPFAAIVVQRLANDQEAVNPGTPILKLADFERTWVEAEVDELDAARVRLGAKTTVGIEGYPGQSWPGEVTYIAPEIGRRTELSNDPSQPDRSSVLRVRIRLLAPAPFKLRQRLEVAIQAGPDPIAQSGSIFDQPAVH
jgi:HlyD family secretion protein